MTQEILSQGDSLFKRIITGKETWIAAFDTEKTQQSSEQRLKDETWLKTPRQSLSNIQKILTLFLIITAMAPCLKKAINKSDNQERYDTWSTKNWRFEVWFNNTLKNNTIRCKKLATIVSSRKNVARPFVRLKQIRHFECLK